MALECFEILGLPVHRCDDWPAWLLARARRGEGTHVVTLNAEMAVRAEADAELRQILRQAEAVVPDGAGIVLALGWRGISLRRQPGIELAEALLARLAAAPERSRVYFYGGKPGIAPAAARYFSEKYGRDLAIETAHGYLSGDDLDAFCNELRQNPPQAILVGLGVPRQELWIARHRHLCPQAVWIGVGGSFDIWAGVKTRAPAWMGKYHLEWAYRLYKEPWRWRRMLALPKFALRALVRG